MKVLIEPTVYAEIDYYVQNSPGEVSGLGRIVKRANGDMYVTKIYLLEQENTGASTDIDDKAIAKLMYETREDEGMLNFWWHSHVDMGVFWSGTDMKTIHSHGNNGFILATVFNKKREMKSAYYQGGNEFLPPVFVDDLETTITTNVDDALEKQWKKNLKDKCKTKTYHNKTVWPGNTYWSDTDKTIFEQVGYGHDEIWGGSTILADSGSNWRQPRKGKKLNSKNKYLNMLGKYLTRDQIEEWRDYYANLKGMETSQVGYKDLHIFYTLWEGDFNSMAAYVIGNIMENEGEAKDA